MKLGAARYESRQLKDSWSEPRDSKVQTKIEILSYSIKFPINQ